MTESFPDLLTHTGGRTTSPTSGDHNFTFTLCIGLMCPDVDSRNYRGWLCPAGSAQLKPTHCRTLLSHSAKMMGSWGKHKKGQKNARWRQVERTKENEKLQREHQGEKRKCTNHWNRDSPAAHWGPADIFWRSSAHVEMGAERRSEDKGPLERKRHLMLTGLPLLYH